MSVSPSDLALAQILARRLLAAGGDRICRIVMIGSRARGTARPDSDLDLVVLLELPADAAAWGPTEVIAERRRLQVALGSMPIPTELSVRTTDRYAEARGVIGGVEQLVDAEGLDVYSRPPTRPPIIRRTPEQVRHEMVSAWVEHAITALAGTLAMEKGQAPTTRAPGQPRSVGEAATICIERTVNAFLVVYQLSMEKGVGIPGKIERLRRADAKAAAWLEGLLRESGMPSVTAQLVLRGALARLSAYPGMQGYIKPSLHRFEAIVRG